MSATYSVTSIPDLTSLFGMAKEDIVVDLSHSARQAITQKKSLQSICLEDSSKKMAATYSPTGMQYHRRDRA